LRLPNLHRPLFKKQQPAQSGTIGDVFRHLLAQGLAPPGVAAADVASCGGHGDQPAIGRQFKHRVGIGRARQGEMLGKKPQIEG
jgi:hypothetical protein